MVANLPKISTVVNAVKHSLSREDLSPHDYATMTLELLITAIKLTKAKTTRELIREIKHIANDLLPIRPSEYVVGNIFRRALDIIRASEEGNENDLGDNTAKTSREGLISLVNVKHQNLEDDIVSKVHKYEMVQEMVDFANEMKDSSKSISGLSVEHIHSRAVILTFGYSELVLNFLLEAGKFRKFEVFAVESAPLYDGRKTALALAQSGIDTTLLPDSSIFAMMARINKVIITAESAFSTGSVLAQIGVKNIVTAAKYHSVPVVVLLELYKITPLNRTELNAPEELGNPSSVMAHSNPLAEKVSVINPKFDLVDSEYIDLFVTRLGGLMPKNIYRLLGELYHSEDRVL